MSYSDIMFVALMACLLIGDIGFIICLVLEGICKKSEDIEKEFKTGTIVFGVICLSGLIALLILAIIMNKKI